MSAALKLHRIAHVLHRAGLQQTARAMSRISQAVFGAVLPPEAIIGGGTELGYGGLGVVVHKDAIVGRNVLLSPGVVIGGRSEMAGVPVIEDDVKIGAGAKILGPIRIGAGAKVGANAVVLHDVEPGETVAGVPARPLQLRAKLKVA
ncbi:MAG TPA: serine acetyltransferase [Myxococcales bacterium]|nr:serine acetyltransferase [Myxococcales bacterium]